MSDKILYFEAPIPKGRPEKVHIRPVTQSGTECERLWIKLKFI